MLVNRNIMRVFFKMRRRPNIRKGVLHLDGKKKIQKGRFFATALPFLAQTASLFVAKFLFEGKRKKK